MKKEWTNPEISELEIRNNINYGVDGDFKGDPTDSPIP